jgi:hypothetical protein
MLTSGRSRPLAFIVLLALLVGLAIWYGSLTPAPALGAYPDVEDLATSSDQYRGETVEVGGRVVDTTPVTIRVEYGASTTDRFTVTDLSVTPVEGEKLRVYGVVEDDQTIQAVNAFTVPPQGQWYAWGTSFLAGLWVLARLIRQWQLDRTNWTLNRRETAVTPQLVKHIRTHIHRTRD